MIMGEASWCEYVRASVVHRTWQVKMCFAPLETKLRSQIGSRL